MCKAFVIDKFIRRTYAKILENFKKMDITKQELNNNILYLNEELNNFQSIAENLVPQAEDSPKLENIDIYGESIHLAGDVGGDHIAYVDFNQRYDLEERINIAKGAGNLKIAENLEKNKRRAGILLADVAGHQTTDSLLAAMLHQSFFIGALYELDNNGEITTKLFENINTRFYNSSSLNKFITMIYGEISNSGKFRFISAAHSAPLLFSNNQDKLVKVSEDRITNYFPIGIVPSIEDIDKSRSDSIMGFKEKYSVNEIDLMDNEDIMILYTDGLSDHANSRGEKYVPRRLESKLKELKEYTSKEIFSGIKEDLLSFNRPEDDISYVIIKKNNL